MNQMMVDSLYGQLEHRRVALASTIAEVGEANDLVRLLADVDRALKRLGTDAYGKCAICGGGMDDVEMLENPSRQYCLCELSPGQQQALQRDLDLAWQVQASLLPDQDISFGGWQLHYRYQPAGPVSGDYCDVITHSATEDWVYFLVGDVSGKGVAASYVMAHLSALVRRTLDEPVPVSSLMETVNRHLLERTTESHFITLVAGRANRDGRVELGNAGHCLPMIVTDGAARTLASTALPLGIATESEYQIHTTDLAKGESLVMYTDGITEARDLDERLYGTARLEKAVSAHRQSTPTRLAAACLEDVRRFQDGAPQSDDVTLMVVRRSME